MLSSLILAAQPDLIDISISNASVIALLGYGVVFFGLILLMTVISIIGAVFIAQSKKKSKNAAAAPTVAVEEAPKPVAPGAAGSLKLYNVAPKTAAMLMAIVANKMGKPLNELRFISIKEVE